MRLKTTLKTNTLLPVREYHQFKALLTRNGTNVYAAFGHGISPFEPRLCFCGSFSYQVCSAML